MSGPAKRDDDWPEQLRLDDHAGPASHLTRAATDALIGRVLDAAGAQAASPMRPVATVITRAKSRFVAWQVAAAATLVLAAGLGGASAARQLWGTRLGEVVITLPRKPAHAVPPRPSTPKHVLTPVVAPLIAPAPASELAAPTPKPRARPPEPKELEDLLQQANSLRAKRDFRDAEAKYAAIVETAPASRAAYVARVASASLHLEQLHDPRGALARYRAALAREPGGALDEEARFGVAESFRALNDSASETRALEDFLAAHPSAALAPKAQARRKQLAEAAAP